MSKSNKKWIFQIVRLLGIALFVAILLRVDLAEISKSILNTKLNFLLIGVFFQLLVLLSKATRWHLMNNGRGEWKYIALNFGRFFESYAIGTVTPARIGEVMKAGHETGRQNIFNAGIRVLAERGIDIGIFVALAGLSVLAGYYLEMNSAFGWLITISGVGVIIFSMLIVTSEKIINNIMHKLRKLPGKWHNIRTQGLSYEKRTTTLIVLLSFISNISYFVSCFFLSKSAGIDAGFLWVTGAVSISGLLNMLPVTIMGLGTRELVFLYIFKTVASQNIILAFSFLMLLIAQIGGGLVSLITGQILLLKTKKYSYD